MKPRALGLALPLVAGCASNPPFPTPPEIQAGPVLSVRGDLLGRGLPSTAPPDASARRSERQVEISCTMLQISSDRAAAILGGTSSGATAGTADRGELERFLDALQELPDVQTTFAPKLTLFDGQSGELSISSETAYVADFELSANHDAWIADPVVDTVRSGTFMRARASLPAETGPVALELSWVLCALGTPMPEIEAELPGDLEVRLQVPVTRTLELSTDVELAPDRVLVTTCPRWDAERGVLLTFVSAREIPGESGGS